MNIIRIERGRLIRSSVEKSDRRLFAVLSTPGVKSDGHNVLGGAWEFPDSVPLLDSHRDYQDGLSSVIGRCYPRLQDGKLVGGLEFASEEVNERAEGAYQLCSNGFVDSVSVGFSVLKATPANEPGRPYGALNISRAKLNEVSVVAVPADEDAKILGRALRAQQLGRATRADREAIARARRARIQREEQNVSNLLMDPGEAGRLLRIERARQVRAGETVRTTPTLAALGYDHHQVDRGEDKLARAQECHRATRRSRMHEAAAQGDVGQGLVDILEEYGADNEPLARDLRRTIKDNNRVVAHHEDGDGSHGELGDVLDSMDDADSVTGPTE